MSQSLQVKPRVISLFSGVGTFDYGFRLAGWETVFLCEWDPKAREVLAARYPGVPISPDVQQVKGAELPDAEVIMFGSPCQDLSVAGKRGGLDGERSGLFREAIRIIQEKREATDGRYPTFALWENVPGAFSSNGGRDFASVIWEFLNCGACDVSWRILDAQFFGVPQRRRRIFLVADFGGERAREILFESEGVSGHPVQSRAPGQSPPADAGQGAEGDSREGELIPTIARCLTARNQRNDAGTENLLPVAFDCKVGAGVGLTVNEDLSPTLLSGSAEHGGRGRVAVAFRWNTGSKVQMPVGHTVSTLLADGDAQAVFATNHHRVRRLTPTETERLQGMPDGWTDVNGMADSHRYRFMGNAGAAPVLKWIAERMKGVLTDEQQHAAD